MREKERRRESDADKERDRGRKREGGRKKKKESGVVTVMTESCNRILIREEDTWHE